jgi:CRP-like cAMP-binding protein
MAVKTARLSMDRIDYPFCNRLLSALSPSDQELVRTLLRPVNLPIKTLIEVPGRVIENVYFFETGFASVLAVGKSPIEIGMIGNEGMTGIGTVMGDDEAVNRTVLRTPAVALEMHVDDLRFAMDRSRTLRVSLSRYAQALFGQASQTILANGRATVAVRLARWLLMAQDRVGEGAIPISHQDLAEALGVRRPTITEALNALEGGDVIRTSRGHIDFVDPKKLKSTAGSFYGGAEAQWFRLLGGIASSITPAPFRLFIAKPHSLLLEEQHAASALISRPTELKSFKSNAGDL